MSILLAAFVADLRTLVMATAATEYERLSQDTWWRILAKERPSESESERLIWLLDDARIRDEAPGSITFDDILALSQEIKHGYAGAGLKLPRAELVDTVNGIVGGKALDAAGHWARQMGALAAYWPQQKIAEAIRANILTYDGKALFALDHPYNPYRPALGNYANDIYGAASGAYPGLVPIHLSGSGAVTIDVARSNVSKVIAYAASILMPSGVHPRKLRPAAMIVPPALVESADLITGAESLPMLAGASAATGDNRPLKRRWGLPDPIQADELGSSFSGGKDTTWYLVMRGVEQSDRGALVYVNREPFQVRYHGPDTDAQLAVIDELQWTMPGRNGVAGGHPYYVFRCHGVAP